MLEILKQIFFSVAFTPFLFFKPNKYAREIENIKHSYKLWIDKEPSVAVKKNSLEFNYLHIERLKSFTGFEFETKLCSNTVLF